MSEKGKHWCLTINTLVEGTHYVREPFEIMFNTDDDEWKDKAHWWVGQLEKAPETGHLHLQVHVCFTKDMRATQVKKWLAAVNCKNQHFEKCKSIEKSLIYVTKADTRELGPFRSANAPAAGAAIQGARSDLDGAIEIIKNGGGLAKVAEQMPEVFIRHHRGFEALAKEISRAPERPTMDTICLYGPPGTGKSTFARRIVEDILPGEVPFYKPIGPWWDGYSTQKAVILDDYDGKGQAMMDVKNMLDKTPCSMQIKGGYRHLHTELFVITSNSDPREWYKDAKTEDVDAVLRRMLIWRIGEPLHGSPERMREAERLREEITTAYRRHDFYDNRRGRHNLDRNHPLFVLPDPVSPRRGSPRKRARLDRGPQIAPAEQQRTITIYLSDSD